MHEVVRFSELFCGLSKAYGQYQNNRSWTVRQPVTDKQYKQHLAGTFPSLGVVPLIDNGTCLFGAVDIDNKGKKADLVVDHHKIATAIAKKALPLIVCRSKSGGAHLFTFVSSPIPARAMRSTLSKWAAQLGFGGHEIFPKQDATSDIGNWINLPYFGDDRVAYDVDGVMNLETFLTRAYQIRDVNPLNEIPAEEYIDDAEMPPCLKHFTENGIEAGSRNEILYNFAVYYKQRYPDDWEDRLAQANFTLLKSPLPLREVRTLAKSVGNKDYRYKCSMPELSQHCDQVECGKLKFGMGQDDKYGDLMLGCLTKHLTDPPRWVLDVNGVNIDMTTEDLFNYHRIRILALEKANIVAPPVKQEDWLKELKDRITNRIEIDAPEDASSSGDLRHLLFEFVHQKLGNSRRGREGLLSGLPVLDMQGSNQVIYFRSQDFLAWIKRRKLTLNIQGNALWMKMKEDLGCGHTRIKVKGHPMQVWSIPVSDDLQTPVLEAKKVSTDTFYDPSETL